MAEQPYQYLTELPPHEKPPCWRWMVALSFVADPSLRLSALTDPFLYRGAEFFRRKAASVDKPASVRRQFPVVSTAYDYFVGSQRLRIKSFLEALMLSDAEDKEIAQMIGIESGPEVIETYRKLFFDVDSYKDKPLWVRANVLSVNPALFDWSNCEDYLMKLFAWTWGAAAFMEYYVMREQSVNRLYSQWFTAQTQKKLHEGAFALAQVRHEDMSRAGVELLKMTKANWDFKDAAAGDKLAEQVRSMVFDQVGRFMNLQLVAATTAPRALEARDSSTFAKLKQLYGTGGRLQLAAVPAGTKQAEAKQ